MTIYLSLLIALIGLLMYGLCADSKAQAVGFAMFQCGLLAFLLCFCQGNHVIGFLGR